MSETEHNQEAAVAEARIDSAAQTEQMVKQGKPFVSAGQFLHKWTTYLGVDWIFNTMCGVAFAYGAKYTKIGQTFWSKPVQSAGLWLLKPVLKTPSALAYSVDKFETFFSIIAGGMMTIPPLMALEKKENRIAISRRIDEAVYGKEKVASDPKFEQSYQAIAEEPPKQFWAGMFSRFAALSPLLAWVLIPKEWATKSPVFKHAIEAKGWYFGKIGDLVDKGVRKLGFSERMLKNGTKWTIDKTAGTLTEVPVTALNKFEDVTKNSTPMDSGLGWPYAILHGLFYPVFAAGEAAIRSPDKKAKPEQQPATQVREISHEKLQPELAPAR